MEKRRLTRPLLVACCLLALACNREKRRLTEHLATLEQQHAAAAQRVDSRREALRDSESRLDALTRELTALNTEVQTFLGNHKIAAACIRTSRSSWGESSAFANELSTESRFGTALCGVALLNGEFAREVAYVTEKLREADKRIKELNEQLAAMRRTVEGDRANLQQEQSAADQLEVEMSDVRHRLAME